ncbi:MAG: TlyA family RNA methyltransferase [Clostridiales bacterium]|jgi:23S rRNA (cytidine1920-2'-O)/16S rRNA (cytidine1409-2'-O)-methyltransferase|nr:TlyA family RNA methyltransferase [Clostridiales bacterium]
MLKRLDILVCEHMGVSREYAKEIILSGKCTVADMTVTKPGARFDADCVIKICAEKLPYVSRGGVKMAHAINKFEIGLKGRLCIDIGASTGGFTDCMLQHGAATVIALDNGHGQLAEKLRHNPRVVSMEGTNIMTADVAALPFVPDFAAVDLSFVSLGKVIPKVSLILGVGGQAIFLLKPQFECGPKALNKKGVVTSLAAHIAAVKKIITAIVDAGMVVLAMDFSPITGQNGNVEYLIFVEK